MGQISFRIWCTTCIWHPALWKKGMMSFISSWEVASKHPQQHVVRCVSDSSVKKRLHFCSPASSLAKIIISTHLLSMEMYADHRGTFWNRLNIYEIYINTVILLIQATTGRCNIVEVELLNIFGDDDAHLSSDQFIKVVSKSKKW